MKNILWCMVCVLVVLFIGNAALAQKAAVKESGEVEFNEHCAVCHPAGGNIINPKKALHKKDREANNIKTEADIIKTMRNPGPGMTKFDEKTVSPREAKEIAKYIVKTFK